MEASRAQQDNQAWLLALGMEPPRAQYGFARVGDGAPRAQYGFARDGDGAPRAQYGFARVGMEAPRAQYGLVLDESIVPFRGLQPIISLSIRS